MRARAWLLLTLACVFAFFIMNKLKEKGYEAKNSREMWRDKKITGLKQMLGMK